MSEILQTQQGQDVRYGCSLTGQPLTGKQVLDTMPSSFVDTQVQFGATAAALEEDLAGVGSTDNDLEAYYNAHSAAFDTACLTAAVFSSQSAAQDAAAQVAFGTPFATVASNTASSGGGAQGCDVLTDLETKLPSSANLQSLATGAVSDPIDDNGTYLLLQITSRTPTPFSKAKAAVANAVQAEGLDGHPQGAHGRRGPFRRQREPAVRGLGARERLRPHASGSRADGRAERHGQCGPGPAGGGVGCGAVRPLQRLSVTQRPHVTVVGLGPAGPDLVGDNAAALLTSAPGRAFLRTARHPAAAAFSDLPRSTTSTRRRGPSTRSMTPLWRRWSWPPSRRRPTRWSTPCPVRR